MEQPKESKINEEAIRLEQEKRKLEASIKEMDTKKKEEKKPKEAPKIEVPNKATVKTCEAALKLLYDRKLELNKEREKLDEEIRKVEHQRNLLKIEGL